MKKRIKYNVGKLIRARQLRRWSQAELAARIGMTENMVYKVENGLRPSEKTIFKMSKVLDVPMEEILPEEMTSRRN